MARAHRASGSPGQGPDRLVLGVLDPGGDLRALVGVLPLNDEEIAFLATRAAASGITAATAAAAVEEVTGRPPQSVEQFAGGWGAVPFWATAADGTRLVVRVGLEERPYVQEAAVLARVRAAGIPAPEVAGVCRVEGRPVSVLVRVEGVPLSELRGADDWVDRCAEAGQWLARVHEIDTTAMDLEPTTSVDDILAIADALEATLPPSGAATIAEAAARLSLLQAPVAPALCHLDFGGDHVLVAGGRVAAIIDWEWAAVTDPARDVAWWQVNDAALEGGAAAVRHGYGPPDGVFDARVWAWAFAICIVATDFRHRMSDPAGATAALRRARALLTGDVSG